MPGAGFAPKREFSIDGNGERVRWLPSPPPGPADLDGRLTNHAMVVSGQQDSDENNFLVIHDLVTTSRGSTVLRMEEQLANAFTHVGKMTDLHVCEQSGGLVTVLLGTTEGALHMLQLVVPRTPGATQEDLKYVDRLQGWQGPSGAPPDPEGVELQSWLRPHRGAVAAVDMQQDTKNILTAGADGSLFVFDIDQVEATCVSAAASAAMDTGGAMDGDGDGDGMVVDTMDTGERRRGGGGGPGGVGGGAGGGLPPGVSPYKAGSGCLGYTCGRWVDRSLFVTSRTVGGLEMWDIRCPPTPVSRSPQEWGATGLGPADRGCHRVIYSLQVHPSRPDVCASGGSGGSVALWDLRAATRPLALTQSDSSAGPVWEVRFDTREGAQYGGDSSGGQQAPLPAVLFCSEDGALCRVSADGGTQQQPAGAGRMEELTWQARQPRQGPQMLAQLPVAINSFDVGGPFGADVVAITSRQTLIYVAAA